ncbi:hypothetical protein FIBSPDRAFT_985752 [Athelia psychrophila]|uniref:Secreted protein n=1 Tax=Athelia psychrophila TaxID=1759441 RepID=A0A166B344_9AGAM|nr:hypothetical protein FIBSPDRAFT_985752 [Fibularhizoctonia sp. CBS 109695]
MLLSIARMTTMRAASLLWAEWTLSYAAKTTTGETEYHRGIAVSAITYGTTSFSTTARTRSMPSAKFLTPRVNPSGMYYSRLDQPVNLLPLSYGLVPISLAAPVVRRDRSNEDFGKISNAQRSTPTI